MIGYFKNRRKKLIKDIANEVTEQLSARHGWEKFLPPVALRDTVYMVTENGSVYALRQDLSGLDHIVTIRRG